MGNPASHHIPEPPEEPPPAPVDLLWRVYQLRDLDGKRLPRGAVIRSAKVGVLTLDTLGASGRASLTDVSGYPPLNNLYDVRRVRIAQSGVLMQGVKTIGSKDGPVDVPSAWWCVPLTSPAPQRDTPGTDSPLPPT